jgi:arsenate reductase
MTSVTLYHNPRCSTSRNALALLRERGIEPTIVEYLKTPPTRDELQALAQATGEPARGLLRTKEPLCAELGLTGDDVSDAQALDALAAHPALLNRPVVRSEHGARVARPIERMLEILP